MWKDKDGYHVTKELMIVNGGILKDGQVNGGILRDDQANDVNDGILWDYHVNDAHVMVSSGMAEFV